MARSKIDDNELLDRLMDVFRLHGYEGASLSRISEATGLQRASLYHRFPGGKEEMAQAVMSRVDEWFVGHILAPLSGEGEPAKRVRKMAARLADFYESGRQSCLLDALSLGGETNALQQHVADSFNAWLGAMATVARQAGASAAAARRRAQDALVQIQGALVFSRATGDARPFERTVAGLPALLTAPSGT